MKIIQKYVKDKLFNGSQDYSKKYISATFINEDAYLI